VVPRTQGKEAKKFPTLKDGVELKNENFGASWVTRERKKTSAHNMCLKLTPSKVLKEGEKLHGGPS